MTNYNWFDVIHDVVYLLVLVGLNYLVIVKATANLADKNNLKKENREKVAELEDTVDNLKVESLESKILKAITESEGRIKTHINNELAPLKTTVGEIKVNQGYLVIELRSLGVNKETPILK